MFKTREFLLEPDVRYQNLVFRSYETGETRPLGIDDLRKMVASIEIEQCVPTQIADQFDIARNAFVYSWFVYEFATLAEQQAYAALEMALRNRFDPLAVPNTTRSPGLRKLIDNAIRKGWLKRADFEVQTYTGSSETNCLLDQIPMLRNHVMHGNVQLFPQGTPDALRLCADIMNQLFASSYS